MGIETKTFDANGFRFCEKASSRVGGVFETWRAMMQRELVVGAQESEWTRVRFLVVEGGGDVGSLLKSPMVMLDVIAEILLYEIFSTPVLPPFAKELLPYSHKKPPYAQDTHQRPYPPEPLFRPPSAFLSSSS